MTTPDPQQLDLERLLFRYSMALERGDFDTVTGILQIAAHNAVLNRMIQELDAVYALESHTDPSAPGDSTVAHLTGPLMRFLPQKRKLGQPNPRSYLIFPFAAAIALVLVGLSVMAFNRQSDEAGSMPAFNPGAETATPTPIPYLIPPTRVNPNNPTLVPPTFVPTEGGIFITFTPTPAGPTEIPTEAGLYLTFTSTPLGLMSIPTLIGPTFVPTVIPPVLGPIPTVIAPDSFPPATIIPPTCEGATKDEGYTRVYALPYPDKTLDTPIDLYEPKTSVIISGSQSDVVRAEMWLFVNNQGWVNALDVVLLPECATGQAAIDAFSQATNLLNRAQSFNPANPTLVPTVMAPFEVTPTATPIR